MSEHIHQAPGFVSTVHDPRGRLLPALQTGVTRFGDYRGVYISATETTDQRVIDILTGSLATVTLRPPGAAGLGRQECLRSALQDRHQTYFYCDLDRWLHWVSHHPAELLGLPSRMARECADAWYVCLGRTPRAFASHPEVQRVAEWATSRALSLVLGYDIDATAGSSWLTLDGARIIAEHSQESTMGTDLEWPALVWKRAPDRIMGMTVEGLEFETLDFVQDEIAAAGGAESWILQTYQQPAMWHARLQLAADSIAALNRALRAPNGSVADGA